MVVNFRVRDISRGARKLARTPTLIKKKKKRGHVYDYEVTGDGAYSREK
jgi:hypothetical protein